MYDLLFADTKGRFYNDPDIKMAGRIGNIFVEPVEQEMIPLPEGSTLVMLPGRTPIGLDSGGGFTLAQDSTEPMLAVGALLPQGYTRTLVPAFQGVGGELLPLYGYAAVGWKDDQVFVAANLTDHELEKWNPVHYSSSDLQEKVKGKLQKFADNRILKQLAKCALEYSCFTAQNIFYCRWEGGIPVSPVCNARCLGCISKQPAECCPSPQERISFTPTVDEIAEIALEHLQKAPDAIISFGQGCEGEPSLAWESISRAIQRLRSVTGEGTINMNTNAGFTKGIKEICDAGIDSLRVSTISAREETYKSYYRPKNYTFADVKKSISLAKDKGVFVALNLLTYPGLTDQEKEFAALVEMIADLGIDMIQFRNLNIDPVYMSKTILPSAVESMGIPALIDCLSSEFPDLIIGSFSRPVK